MRRIALGLLSVVAVVGCSQPTGQPPVASKASSPAAVEQPLDPATTRAIAKSADAFMRAILSGDAPIASRLLTTKAAARYAADPAVLTPMGMQVERLDIGEVRLLSPAEAAAQCLVSDPGATAPQELCCLLKHEAAGWRVCGVACDPGAEGGTPTVVSFEDEPEPAAPATQYVGEGVISPQTPRTAGRPADGEVR